MKHVVTAHADIVGSLLRSIIGNAISVEDEEYELRTIVETAEQLWG